MTGKNPGSHYYYTPYTLYLAQWILTDVDLWYFTWSKNVWPFFHVNIITRSLIVNRPTLRRACSRYVSYQKRHPWFSITRVFHDIPLVFFEVPWWLITYALSLIYKNDLLKHVKMHALQSHWNPWVLGWIPLVSTCVQKMTELADWIATTGGILLLSRKRSPGQ